MVDISIRRFCVPVPKQGLRDHCCTVRTKTDRDRQRERERQYTEIKNEGTNEGNKGEVKKQEEEAKCVLHSTVIL